MECRVVTCDGSPVVGRGAVEVCVRHFEMAGDERFEHDLCRWNASDGQCALRGAMVRHRSADDLVARGLARKLEVPGKRVTKNTDEKGSLTA